MRSSINGHRIFSAFALVVLAAAFARADVAPDPGFKYVSANLIIESGGDLSQFRFFLASPARIEEVKLSNGRTVVSASGRAGAGRFGKLIAIPVTDITISGDLTESVLESSIRRGAFPNARTLLSHNFRATVSVLEEPFFKHPVYRLSTDSGELTAEFVEGTSKLSAGSGIFWTLFPFAIFAVLAAGGIAIIGIWFLRRRSKRAAVA